MNQTAATRVSSLLELLDQIEVGPRASATLCLDAVGTLIHANPPVLDVYAAAGAAVGLQLQRDELAQRFRRAWERLQLDQAGPGGEGATCEAAERQRWRAFVRQVFVEVADRDHPPLFERLWEHFATPAHWRCFPEVPEALQRLTRAGRRWVIASNFDARLHAVCRGLPALAMVAPTDILISSELGFAKPATGFYRAVEQRLQLPATACLMVGDDQRNDIDGALSAGWDAIWVQRPPAVGSASS